MPQKAPVSASHQRRRRHHRNISFVCFPKSLQLARTRGSHKPTSLLGDRRPVMLTSCRRRRPGFLCGARVVGIFRAPNAAAEHAHQPARWPTVRARCLGATGAGSSPGCPLAGQATSFQQVDPSWRPVRMQMIRFCEPPKRTALSLCRHSCAFVCSALFCPLEQAAQEGDRPT